MTTTTNPAAEASTATPAQPLLDIRNLEVNFETKEGSVPAVRGIDLTIYPGQSVAIVGESGSGKSTTAQAIIDLLPGSGHVTGGEILFEGRDLSKLPASELTKIRGERIGYVPQDPMSNLNPVWSIGFQVEEAIKFNNVATGTRAIRKRAIEVLTEAGLPDASSRLRQYPHEFSGGMRQRALIGIGMSARPKLLIADEPTSALDVTVQRQILDHLETLTSQYGTSVLFITHDLGLAADRAEHLVVMYRGKVVESGPSREILTDPQHPYTKRLVGAAPSLASKRLEVLRQDNDLPTELTGAIEQQMLEHAQEREEVADETPAHSEALINITDARKVYRLRTRGFQKKEVVAVNDVSVQIERGTTTAIVGESGSGKSTLAKLFLQLEPATSGSIKFDGVELAGLGKRELLDQVALPKGLRDRYPSELSGGQRQRVAVARALALKPEVLVLDEAVSALDVLVQGQILQLLTQLQTDLGLTYMFITHDLAVVRLVADNVCVMRKGEIVERGTTDALFDNPREEYTQQLLAAIPGANFEFGA
jgi:peptide/nickel transport system ATP-binding protein